MLNILLGKENKPDNLVVDVEKVIYEIGIPDTSLSRYLLKELERAKYLDKSSFIDRDGFKLPVNFLSNGMKILLCTEYSDKCMYGVELGQNAFEFLIQSIDGTVYFDSADRFKLPEYFDLSRVSINGIVADSVYNLEGLLWREL